MAEELLLLIRHQAPLRVIGEAEALAVLTLPERSLRRRDVEIDTRPFAEDVDGGHWRSSHAYIRQAAADLRAAADTVGSARVLYFSMAEVPQVLALGAYLGDERYVEVHDYDRDLHTWTWRSEQQTLDVELDNLPQEHVAQPGLVIVCVEISYPIADTDVDAAVGKERLAHVRLRPAGGRSPSPSIVMSAQDVAVVRREFRKAVQAILDARPATEVIHLFVAAPVSVCLGIGQELRLRNSRDVQTYRYRRADGDKSYKPAILLTAGALREVERPLTSDEIALAARLREVWRRALEDVIGYSLAVRKEVAGSVGHWYDYLTFQRVIEQAPPFAGLRPIWEMVDSRDSVSADPRSEDYAFDKDGGRLWRLSDRLLLGFSRGVGGDDERCENWYASFCSTNTCMIGRT